MSTEFPGFSGPAASTEAPLEMLAACHIRIERQCATLRRLAAHLTEHGADADARTAAMHVMRYFETAAVQQHAAAEADLFPILIASMAGSEAVTIRNNTTRLSEHDSAPIPVGRGTSKSAKRRGRRQAAAFTAN